MHARQAFSDAGFKPDAGNTSRLKSNPKVKARITYLQGRGLVVRAERTEAAAIERVIERTAITKERIMLELAKIGFANMGNYTRLVGEDRVIDLSQCTEDHLAAITELTVEDYKDGRGPDARDVRRTRIRIAPKLNALVQMGREIGMFTEKHDHTHTIEQRLAAMTPEERGRDAVELRDRVRARMLEAREAKLAAAAEAAPVTDAVFEEVVPTNSGEEADDMPPNGGIGPQIKI